jgi:hemophore-related protein
LSVSSGSAAADVNSTLAPLINTTCSYAQITKALNAEAPDLAGLLNGRPQAQARLQSFLLLPADQRQAAIDKGLAANPQVEAMINAQLGSTAAQEITQVASDCGKY